MDTTTSTPPTALSAYRRALYACFTRARDALFDLCDALATDPAARSFVALSQAPCFQRQWPSVYEALEDGRIECTALRALFQATAPRPAAGARTVLALDSSPIVRPYARTAPDRTLVHVPAAGQVLPPHTAPVRPGWAFSTLVVVPPAPSSWTHILDNQRIPSDQTALTVGAAQLAALVPTCTQEEEQEADGAEPGVRPLLLADGSYGTAGWVEATADLALDQLVRAASTRVLYRAAPPPTGKAGAPRKDGDRFKGSDPATHGEPDAAWTGPDAHGQEVTVRCWGGLHRKECRHIPLTAVCLTRPAATNAKGDLRETWFWWLGGRPLPPLADLARLYPRRFDSVRHTGPTSVVAQAHATLPLVVLSEVTAGGVSMALGGYLSARTEGDILAYRIEIERRETEPEEERVELRDIYRKKGLNGRLLDRVIAHQTADHDRWLNALVCDKLGVVEDEPVSPLRQGIQIGASFVLGGLIPTLPVLFGLPTPAMQSATYGLTALIALELRPSRRATASRDRCATGSNSSPSSRPAPSSAPSSARRSTQRSGRGVHHPGRDVHHPDGATLHPHSAQ